jgi:SET domain-containing protein
VYGAAALFNHACAPNCVTAFGGGGVLTVTAARPVRAGEELLISYLGGGGGSGGSGGSGGGGGGGGGGGEAMGTEERRARLRKQFAFECGCALCSAGR